MDVSSKRRGACSKCTIMRGDNTLQRKPFFSSLVGMFKVQQLTSFPFSRPTCNRDFPEQTFPGLFSSCLSYGRSSSEPVINQCFLNSCKLILEDQRSKQLSSFSKATVQCTTCSTLFFGEYFMDRMKMTSTKYVKTF